ncbi:MAG TPA: sulfatase-like hydrolase/transferase [Thermoanaerobaculia bacterium]|nr:sulfatase-like hydrolase/transferase [Thermoanaerobaculia bacterium]
MGALVALTLFSCKGNRTLPAASPSTPVFLISIDTLRSDHLPAYGYKGVETPHIDALRGDGILYERAYSHTPLTLPSHTSMLTGLLPSEHGVRDNIGFQLRPTAKTITESLHERGYATGAAVSAFVLRREGGLNRGFDLYDDEVAVLPERRGQPLLANIQRDGAATAQVAENWIAKQQKPVFFFLHIYEPHSPYTPPEPFRSRYASAPYDGEIARADEIVGQYLQWLKDQGLYDKALIILLSDHGEGLNDHGEEEHGTFLYREAIQVPLIVKLPQQKFAGDSVAAPVQLIDLVPTIVERTTAAAPNKLAGRSLLSFLDAKSPEKRAVYSETYYARFHFGWADQHSLIDGERHYIQSPKPELFNVRDDPAEKNNVLTQDRRGFFAMKAAIAPLIRDAEAPSAVNPEDVAKLTALGYLGSTAQTKPGEVLDDPKDHVATIKQIGVAYQRFHERKYDETLQVIDRVLAANPRMVDLYELKSKALKKLGRREEAIATAKEGLRLSPQALHLAMEIANLQLEGREFDDAEKHAELAMRIEPGQAHGILARIWMEKKDLAKAESEARLALESDRYRANALVTLARVEIEQNQLDRAIEHLNEAERVKKPDQDVLGLFFFRGDALARLGRAEEAERDFRKEIELYPDEPLAYKNIVLLLVAEGRIPEATQLVRKLIQESPTPPSYIAVCQVLQTVGDARGVKYWARQGLAKYPNHPGLKRLAG